MRLKIRLSGYLPEIQAMLGVLDRVGVDLSGVSRPHENTKGDVGYRVYGSVEFDPAVFAHVVVEPEPAPEQAPDRPALDTSPAALPPGRPQLPAPPRQLDGPAA